MFDAYNVVLILHNLVRWIVLIAGIVAAGRALFGWLQRRNWEDIDNTLGLLFTVSLDTQVLLGLILYFVLSPITTANFSNFGEAMGNDTVRFYLVEHILLMLVALGLAHMGRAFSKRQTEPTAKHRMAAIFFSISIILVLAGIPWDRVLFRLG